MQVIESMVSKARNESGNKFQRVEGALFCKKCGSQFNEVELIELNDLECVICGSTDFIKGDFAAVLAGYLVLDKKGTLKKYYDEVMNRKFSAVKMNNKRVVFQLLVRDKFISYNDDVMEKIINKVMWRKF